MRTWAHHFTTVLLAFTALLLFWSTQAAWGRLEFGADRYKVGLLGVTRIVNAGSSSERNERCGWYDAAPVAAHCVPAVNGRGAYRLVRLAPVAAAMCEVAFVLAVFAHLRRGSGVTGTGLAPFAVAGATSLVVSNLMMRSVSRALAIAAGREFEMSGTGLTASWLAAGLLLAAAGLSLYSAPVPQSSE
jgi:hypothetical protein